jgi:hypothetical protein
LERQKKALTSAGVDSEAADVFTLEEDPAPGYPIARVTGQDIGQCALARPVGAHEGVNLTWPHCEVHPMENLGVSSAYSQLLDLK